MTEVLLQVKEIPLPPEQYVQTIQRGEIVDYKIDNWAWSNKELKSNRWRILRSNVTLTEIEFLSRNEEDQFNNKVNSWIRQRKFDFDNVLISQNILDWLNDDSRTIPILDVPTFIFREESLWIDKGEAEDYISQAGN